MVQRSSPRARKAISTPKVISLWASILVVIVALAVITISQLNKNMYSAEAFVEEYLGYLSEGDGSQALDMLQNQQVQDQAVLLDGSALSGSMGHLDDVRVQGSRELDGETDVTVAYTVNGQELTSHLSVTQTGTTWLFFKTWAITNPLGTIEVTNGEPGAAVLVNDTAAPLDEGKARLSTFVPGAAHITDNGEYLASTAATVVVDEPGTVVPVTLEPKPTEALVEAVNEELKTYLDGCAQQQVLQPAGCPLAHQTTERVDSSTIQWAITAYPSAKIREAGDEWEMPAQPFTAELKYTGIDLMTGEVREQTVEVNSEVEADLIVAPNQFHAQPSVTQEWLETTSQ